MNVCRENRELSWLKFNDRVLMQAKDPQVPLAEKLSFISIYQTNLDEFFMVRIGSLYDQMLFYPDSKDNKTGMTGLEQLKACLKKVHYLNKKKDRIYENVMSELGRSGWSVIKYKDIESKEDRRYFADYFDTSSSSFKNFAFSWGEYLGNVYLSLSKDVLLYSDSTGYRRSLYGLISQLQQVLASDDDLQLKNDNKANEDAATDAFVNGNSSKTSLGPSDFGNLKDVGGSFNDLTSLNGQSSVTSFLNGLTSADGTGQGWFSEATRASLDAVSPASTNMVRAYDVYRGERSSTYVILSDVSLVSPDMYSEPVDVASSVSSDDPYNMSGFEDNYNWLWGDAS